MSKINNITKYKKAKKYIKDFNELVPIFKKFITDIEPFTRYTMVVDTYAEAQDNLKLLQLHLSEQNKIIETKGEE